MIKNNKKFLWGSATASYQCEGAWNVDGKGRSIWDDFSHNSPLNINNVTGDIACDHYHRYEEDLDMMVNSNQNSYRFSLSWPRIIPDGTGTPNSKGIEYYHRLIDAILERGIEPNVTLYHWDLPKALADKGGWENVETAYAFAEFSKLVFSEYGEKVKIWVTINEPKYSIFSMYGSGNYPPNVRDGQRLIEASYNTMLASALAVKEFRKFKDIGKIGIVADYDPVYTIDKDEASIRAGRLADHVLNNWVTDTAIKGQFPQELISELKKKYNLDFMMEEHRSIFKEGTVDFIGINAYLRAIIRPYTGGPSMRTSNNDGKVADYDIDGYKKYMVVKDMFEQVVPKSDNVTDWDHEIFPESIYTTTKEIQKKYGDIPIYITENGLGLREEPDQNGYINDTKRIEFLDGNIKYLLKAREEGVNIQGYYIWSTFDLYSWVNGYEKRYGLVYIDFEDEELKRVPKASYYWYRDFISNYFNE